MTNTHTIYTSTEKQPVVYPEMENLLPYLNDDEYAALETDILANGCYSPITVTQKFVIVDGHHRYRICRENNLPFQMQVFEFEDLLEAKQWALDTQRARRNLTKWQLAKIAMNLRPELVEQAKANQGTRTDLFPDLGNSVVPINSTKAMADSVKIGKNTMSKALQVKASGLSSVEQALDQDAISVDRAYKIVKQVAELSEEQRERAATDAVQAAINGVSVTDTGEYVPREFYDAVENGDIQQSDSGLLLNTLLKARPEDRDELVKDVIEGGITIRETDRKSTADFHTARAYIDAFHNANQLKPTVDAIRAWVSYTAMDELGIELRVEEAYEISEKFQTIADILKTEFLPEDRAETAVDVEYEEVA